jgi:glutathione S-transferase
MSQPTLYYFAARGRAELIRLLLAEAGIDYLEHPIGQGTPPLSGRPTDLKALQATGFLPFGAVPVWEEPDGFVLAQSGAIASHLARVHGFAGKTARDAARCDELLGAFDDVRMEMRKLATAGPEARATLREQLASQFLPRWFGYFDRRIQARQGGGQFLVGDGLTVADLALWYLVEMCRDNGFSASVAAYPALLGHAERVGSRPRIAEYVKSAKRHPFVPLPK